MKKVFDITGKVFTRLTVLSEEGRDKHGKVMWLCECSCGNKVITQGSALKSGNTKSCGCLHKEKMRDILTTHGLRTHPLYIVWGGMKTRCYNESFHQYADYGGRGIRVCDRWLESFENFYHDVLDGYKSGLQLDRKDNNGDYEPSNIRWVTTGQNGMNRRGSKNSTSFYKGVSWKSSLNKWVAQIQINGKKQHLGYFADELEAAKVYNAFAKNMFGEYANINTIDEGN